MDTPELKRWFLLNQRDLPWRHQPTPYQVWVSEVMLQQTQAQTVIPYYLRWMEELPTLKALAEAPLEKVIKLWEGLGYYSRARHLHLGAQQILHEHQGQIPSDPAVLAQIKGLGPYTIGALLAFAFHRKASAVDGNVIRVLSRHMALEEDISRPKTIVRIREEVESILPEDEPWIVTEALIELGARVCTRAPKCSHCPIRSSCKGYLKGDPTKYPVKSKKIQYETLYRSVFVIRHEDHLLVRQAQSGEIMEGLHEFPYLEHERPSSPPNSFHPSLPPGEPLPLVKHTFTRYRVTLFPHHVHLDELLPLPGYHWKKIPELKKVAFNSGHRRVFEEVLLHAPITH